MISLFEPHYHSNTSLCSKLLFLPVSDGHTYYIKIPELNAPNIALQKAAPSHHSLATTFNLYCPNQSLPKLKGMTRCISNSCLGW